MRTVLTGVQPSGQVHIGNYLGAMKPAISMCNEADVKGWLFLADYHAVTSTQDPKILSEMIYDLAASWIACGLDPAKTNIYRQSHIPEIFELQWILSCVAPKGLLNRAHAYKAKVQKNQESGNHDPDDGVSMGLFNYPVLMAADILVLQADEVPVGEDQKQHVEIARDLAEKFNRVYGEGIIKVPKMDEKKSITITGIDGRKMSKSYDNHLPIFMEPKKLRKRVMKIVTDSSAPEDPKDPNDSLLFDYYKFFATADQIEEMRKKYQEGIGWGYVKQDLYEAIEAHFAEPRKKYEELMNNKDELDAILKVGAEKAREMAADFMDQVRAAIGMRRNI